MEAERHRSMSERYLEQIGVRPSPRATCPFDPGYDPVTVESHLEQSAHLIATLKISMACWMVAEEQATRRKIAAANRVGVATVAGGGPFETAVAQRALPAYLDLCADVGLSRVECGEGFTELPVAPEEIVRQVSERGLDVEFELGEKHTGSFSDRETAELIDVGRRWLDAGAVRLVIEARESAEDVGLFSAAGEFDAGQAERFADAFGLETVLFEAPNKASQFALINHFGPEVQLGNVRLEEVLRVEIYRRGLHSDAFRHSNLRPRAPLDEAG
jgi:phosphosulfolactate synthase